MLFLVSWFHSSFSKRQQNFGNWKYWKYILSSRYSHSILLYERWSVHQGSEVGKDRFHMWKKCKYPAQIAYKAAGTVIHQQHLGFCLHSSHITGMWKGVLFFGKSKGDILMWITMLGMLNPCRTRGRRLLPHIIGFCILVLFLLKQFCYSQKLFQYVLEKEK